MTQAETNVRGLFPYQESSYGRITTKGLFTKGYLRFLDIELGAPLTFTATDAKTEKPGEFTVLPIGRYEGAGSLTSVVFRYIKRNGFNFNLFGSSNQPFELPDGAEFTVTSSGHLVERLDQNHYDRTAIQIGQNLDLGIDYFDGDELHHIAVQNVAQVFIGETEKDFTPPDLAQFIQEIESANRR